MAPEWLNLFCTPVLTGTGTTAGFTYTQIPNDTSDDKQRWTVELGGTDTWPQEYKVAGCTGKKLDLSFKHGDVWRANVDLVGVLVATGAKTGALTRRTPIHVEGSGTKLWIDTSTFGSTAISARLLSGSFTIEDGVTDRITLDGNTVGPDLYAPSKTIVNAQRKVSCKLVLDFTAATEYTAFRAATIQKVQIQRIGAAIGSGFYTETINIAGAWRTFAMGDDAGEMTAAIELGGMYDTGLAADYKFVTINNVATIP